MTIASLIAATLLFPNPSASTTTLQEPKAEKSVLDSLPLYVGPKKRLAVQDMEVKVQVTISNNYTGTGTDTTVSAPVTPPAEFSQGMTEMLVTALTKTNRFVMLERSDKGVADIQKEQTLQGVSDATRAAANALMGAEMLVRGAITEYAYSQSGGGASGLVAGLGLDQSSSTATVTIDVRIYDASTGEIYDSQKAEGKAKASRRTVSFTSDDFKVATGSFQNTPLGKATREAIEKGVYFICKKMDSRPWEAKVADVVEDEKNTTELYLNVGSASGVKAGDSFEVYHPGRVIMDPDNPGRVIARTKGRKFGKCKVVSVEKNISVASVVEGEGFAAKDVVRLPEPVATPPAGGR